MRAAALATAVGALGCGLATLAGFPASPRPVVTRAVDWDALFEQPGTWSGADGTYSVALSGGRAALFLFGDTLLAGEGKFLLVRNTLARLEGNRPDPAALRFLWRRTPDGLPRAALEPLATEDWYWPQDGLVSGGTVHLFVLRVTDAGGETGQFDFRVRGAELLSFPARQALPPAVVIRRALPAAEDGHGSALVFGASVLGGPGESTGDRFVYVYGWREGARGKELLAARVAEHELGDFDAWRYWDGRAWVAEARAAATLADRVSAELGVAPLADGRFVLVHQLDGVGRRTVARLAPTPVGPFGPRIPLWECPEAELVDVYCYNAKPHPFFSGREHLLVSYNVNLAAVAAEPAALAAIYRPRFLRVPVAVLDAQPSASAE